MQNLRLIVNISLNVLSAIILLSIYIDRLNECISFLSHYIINVPSFPYGEQ